jgi:uncharacterized protein
MWLRDSAHQLQSYASLLKPSSRASSLASLFRGAINLQARYILTSPHCNAFRAPVEANFSSMFVPYGGGNDFVVPFPDPEVVFECKYELDSLASFLQLSTTYFTQTNDKNFFSRGNWTNAVEMILKTTTELLEGTYEETGAVAFSPYQFQRSTTTASETLPNAGSGAPVKGGTGMVRSAFRPSDDACVFQLFVPANMMFARYLATSADIMDSIDAALAERMRTFAASVRAGIERYGRVNHRLFGKVYAYEVDGYGSYRMMVSFNYGISRGRQRSVTGF